jgi:predicted proteasome-type protease
MTSKEKAKELVKKYQIKVGVFFTEDSIQRIVNADMRIQSAKQCALISVDEILKHCYEVMKPFWEEVKSEIEKL